MSRLSGGCAPDGQIELDHNERLNVDGVVDGILGDLGANFKG
jgi:hypothetical protein